MKNILKIGLLLGVCLSSGVALSYGFYGPGYGYGPGFYGRPVSCGGFYGGCGPRVVVPTCNTCGYCGDRFFNNGYYRTTGARVWVPAHHTSCGLFVPGHWRFRY